MENYSIVLKVNLKKIANTSNNGFRFTQTGEQTCLAELLLHSFFVNDRCEIDLSGNNSWKIHTTNLIQA